MSRLRIAPLCFLSATLFVVSCNSKPPEAAYVPISELEQTFGRLITVANIPTPDQHAQGIGRDYLVMTPVRFGEYR